MDDRTVYTWYVCRRVRLPLDLFVEMIPYKETRGYVKQVTADFHAYSALYGAADKQPKLSLAVPPAPAEGVRF